MTDSLLLPGPLAALTAEIFSANGSGEPIGSTLIPDSAAAPVTAHPADEG